MLALHTLGSRGLSELPYDTCMCHDHGVGERWKKSVLDVFHREQNLVNNIGLHVYANIAHFFMGQRFIHMIEFQ